MDRRDFLKYGSLGAAGVTVGASGALDALLPEAALAKSASKGRGCKPWKFGVMADTQWPKNLDGLNPGTCAVGIINLLNPRFAHHGVEFVIQVGDLIDKEVDSPNGGTARNLPVRAQAAESLYDCGIGFFPLRGNHEGSQIAAGEFQTLFPQAQGVGSRVFGAENFSSPSAALKGLSYSFDYNNVRFVLLDQFIRPDGTGADVNTATIDQLPWVESTLDGRPSGTHAFVMGHKNLVGQNHVDTLFGADPSQNPAARNTFITSLAKHGVRYYLGGHDHMHHRSLVKSPDGAAAVKQVICSSNSYKFYTPWAPQAPATVADPGYAGVMGNDAYFDNPPREMPFGQELYSVGYYIYTVDGPRVTVEFWATTAGLPYNTLDGHSLTTTPTNTGFYKRDTWGYSLNGKEFVIAAGGALNVVKDSYKGTTAKILSGTNGNTATDSDLRPLSKDVNTGWWTCGIAGHAASHTLSLWGLNSNLALWDKTQTALLPASKSPTQTDTYTLSMSYEGFAFGRMGIAARNEHGDWVNAVDLNTGGSKHFVNGPWKPAYGLGTWGMDYNTRTAWAVLNNEGDFVVTRGM